MARSSNQDHYHMYHLPNDHFSDPLPISQYHNGPSLRSSDHHQLVASVQESLNGLSLSGSISYNKYTTPTDINPYYRGVLRPAMRSFTAENEDTAHSPSNSDITWSNIFNPPLWNNNASTGRRPVTFSAIESGLHRPININSNAFLLPLPTPCDCMLLSAENLMGRVASIAKHPTQSAVLKSGLSRDNLFVGPQELGLIFLEVKEQVRQLMMHRHANDVVQKLVEVCTHQQITQLLHAVVRGRDISFQEICMNPYGSRALQKIVDRLETREDKRILISNLVPITLSLVHNPSGYHIIDQCLTSKFSYNEIQCIVEQIAENCVNIATDKGGCIVVKSCIEHAPLEVKYRMACQLSAVALTLSQHHFGNYVVQYVIEKVGEVRGKIVGELEGSFVALSMNKYASNVIEKCLRAGEEHATRIITEMMNHPQFLQLIRDDYGNYVAQQALNVSKGYIHKGLADLIQLHYRDLHSHPYGKRVLALARGSRRHYRLSNTQ